MSWDMGSDQFEAKQSHRAIDNGHYSTSEDDDYHETSSSSEDQDYSFTSVSNSSSSSSSNGPLYQLSELVAHLPLKRGLSMYYDGKSQSYTSLASVKSVEDLEKRENPIRKKIKVSKTAIERGSDDHKFIIRNPKSTISKKTSTISRTRRKTGSLLGTSVSAIPINGR